MSRNQRRNRRNKTSGNPPANRDGRRADVEDRSPQPVAHRSSSETKSSLKTTELIAYAATVLAVIMTALALDEDGQGGADPFGAEDAIRYVTYLTVGYLIARGLAKSGSHENRVERHTDDDPAPTSVVQASDAEDTDGDTAAANDDDDDVDTDDDDDRLGSDAENVDTDTDTELSDEEVEHAGAGHPGTRP